MDQRLVADVMLFGFFPKVVQELRVNANGNELPCDLTERRAAHAPHRAQLSIGHLRDIGKINSVPSDS